MEAKRTLNSSSSMRKRRKLMSAKDTVQLSRELGEVYVIGEGMSGQLGLKVDEVDHLTSVSGLKNEDVIQVAAGGMHTLCLARNGRVFSFGCNDQGALGRLTKDEEDWFNPSIVNKLQRYHVVSVSCGDTHSSAITDTGRLFVWGTFRLESGECHLIGPASSSALPVECFLPEKIIKVSSGNHHLLLLTESKHLLSIGAGERGQLGRIPQYLIEKWSSRAKTLMFWPDSVIFAPDDDEEIENMWAGSYNSFARSIGGEIFAWGLNNYHQLGFKDIRTKFFPSPWNFVGAKSVEVVELSGGDHHTLALDRKGRIFSIGKGHYGQLGRGDADVCDKFFQVSALSRTPCSSVCAGLDVSFAVSCRGELYAWGQAGSHIGSTENDLKFPELMTCCRKVVKASSRGLHAIALSVD